MAYMVKSVRVEGFQNHRSINLSLKPSVNFIIGRNGTGKTSFIRLLHACCSLDIEELSQINFKSVHVTFSDVVNKTSPVLYIDRGDLGREHFTFKFKSKGNQSFIEYFVDSDGSLGGNFGNFTSATRAMSQFFSTTRTSEKLRPLTQLRRDIRKHLSFSWLPLLRSRSSYGRRQDLYLPEQQEEPVNRKVRELIGQITTYLSTLDSKVAESNKEFQRDIFVSYLEPGLWNEGSLTHIDLIRERETLVQLFHEMDFHTPNILSKLGQFFTRAEITKARLVATPNSYLTDDLGNIIAINALHRIVSSFEKYIDRKSNIYSPKDKFIAILNDMLYRKAVYFDDGNVLNVRLIDNPSTSELVKDELSPYALSSGERQLFIILAEALLQQQRPYVFMADEPELSLHVEWQEKLVPTIREINPNSQIIFATHSPDLVSIYQDNVIDFETV